MLHRLDVMSASKKICFVGSDNYPVLNPAFGDSYIGGESVQQTMLALEFVSMGFETSTVVKDIGQEDGGEVKGIRVWNTFSDKGGVPVLRFLHPRMTGLWKALKRADADIYYQSCAGVATGVVAAFCKRYKRKFVFRVAHDTDCIPGEELIPYKRDKMIYQYGLRNADLVVAQSQQQQELLRQYYGIDAPELNMVVELPEGEASARDVDVLWVNNYRPFKRPERVPEIARQLPGVNFMMIGGPCPGHERLFEDVKRASERLPNLNVMGFVPYHDVNALYGRARVFLNTSDSEGFPNSFLQAWVRGVPVISFFDPDNIIEREQLGAAPRDVPEMLAAIEGLLGAEDAQRMSDHVREFALNRYSPGAVARRYLELFEVSGVMGQQG